MALTPEEIAKILEDEAKQKTTKKSGGKRGPRADPTEPREINVWFKLSHHLCTTECEHREQSPTGKACWNPDCVDTRSSDDRGTNIVAMVHDQNICRYCFLAGYLSPTS